MSLAPLSDGLVREVFGDPDPFILDDGTVGDGWPQQILTYITLPRPLPLSWDRTKVARRLQCHKLIAPLLGAALAEIFSTGRAVWASINDTGGCYAFRPVRGKRVLSRHAWAIAIDLDVRDNPFLGLVPRVHPEVKRIMLEHGFIWGGATIWGGSFPWSRRDPQHFEFAEMRRLA